MKAMIFDMDGVLVNTEPLHYECWKAALADEGVDMSYEVYKPCIGSTVSYLMKLLKEAYGETVSDAETLRARMYAKKEEIVQKNGFIAADLSSNFIQCLHQIRKYQMLQRRTGGFFRKMQGV